MQETRRPSGAVQPESLIGQTLRDGEYVIERVLGHGGMGKVYLARHTTLDIQLAIKQARADQPLPESVVSELDAVLHGTTDDSGETGMPAWDDFPDSGGVHTDQFLREALLLARLEHPAIPTLYDYFSEDGYWYLVMDYIPGPTLSLYLRKHAPLPPLEALNYAMQLCDVLEYLHKQEPPIIFRDLKPSNIILMPGGALMLVDFGISRYFKVGQVNDTVDFGSPGYASPEQYQGQGQTDGRSDLFSLGIILHEMLTGKRPVGLGLPLESPQQLNQKVTAALSGLVMLATRMEPEARIQSAQDFYQALERIYATEEWRAYKRSLAQEGHDKSAPTETQEASGEGPALMPGDAKATELSVNLDHRRQIRLALQNIHRERIEQAQTKSLLATADESWDRSASAGNSQAAAQKPVEGGILVNSTHPVQRALQVSFMAVLALFIVVTCVFSYIYAKQHPNAAPRIQLTPGSAAVTSKAWKTLPMLPQPEADNTAIYVQVQGRPYIYMTGGYRSHSVAPHYDHALYRYDILASHWEVASSGNFPGMLNNAVVNDGQGHLFYTIGYSTDTYTVISALYQYQISDGTLHKIVPPAEMPIGFGGAMLADQQGHLYISQGFMQGGQPQMQAGTGWYRYDIATGHWQMLAPLPQGLGYTLLAADNSGSLLLIGGAQDEGQHLQKNQVLIYDIAGDSWELLGQTTPFPVSGAASCVLPGKAGQMVIIGGYDPQHAQGLDQVWRVDLHTLNWTPLPSLPSGGSALAAAACDDKGSVFVERGADTPNTPTQDFWQFTP